MRFSRKAHLNHLKSHRMMSMDVIPNAKVRNKCQTTKYFIRFITQLKQQSLYTSPNDKGYSLRSCPRPQTDRSVQADCQSSEAQQENKTRRPRNG